MFVVFNFNQFSLPELRAPFTNLGLLLRIPTTTLEKEGVTSDGFQVTALTEAVHDSETKTDCKKEHTRVVFPLFHIKVGS